MSAPGYRVDDTTLFPLEARSLAYHAGGQRLIDGIDLTLNGGQRSVIVGPNGAGKSLLLRLLHGLLAPEDGTVRWAGRPADGAVVRRQAMVFQRPVLLRRSVAANLRYALQHDGLARDEISTGGSTRWLENAGLAALAQRPARRLSGGEQQRLALARALSRQPAILFLDEPTASLDPASTLAIEAMIQQAHEAGTKIVLVTHDLGQARRLADEVIFLHHGRVEAQGPAATFFDQPSSAKAAAFLAGRIVL